MFSRLPFIVHIFLILFLILASYLWAQEENDILNPPTGPVENLIPYGSDENLAFYKTLTNNYRISVQAHIVRLSDGTGGISESDVTQSIQYLNQTYQTNGMDINFVLLGIDYLNNSAYYSFPYADPKAQQLFNLYTQSGVFHLIIIQDLEEAYGLSESVPCRKIIMEQGAMLNLETLPHEFGHAFGLYHTFQTSLMEDLGESISIPEHVT